MEGLHKLPIGIQDFESLRNDGYLYVDKTEVVYKLVSTGRYYFLSRPRRFGKSLLLSTLKSFFEGKRYLFEDLAISSKPDIDWAVRPIMQLDLNADKYDSKDVLTDRLSLFLSQQESIYGTDVKEKTLGARFEGVIRRAHEKSGRRVVILVDEYDKPILQVIEKPELQEAYRDTLKGFYGALKSMDAHIKFAFLTGVTKFGKVNVFSDLNQLRDISMLVDYYDICGITESELSTFFKKELQVLAVANGMKKKYDGYHFEETAPGIYNPYSVLNTFANRKFGNYWFETGTPSYLVYLLQNSDYNLENLSRVQTTTDIMTATDALTADPIPVIYQSGYLTINGYDPRFKTYTLGFPNEEVEEGFLKYLMPCYIYPKDRQSPFLVDNFVRDVENGDTEQLITRLKSLFADTPYEIVRSLENHYQNVIWILFKLMGYYTQAEYRTSSGRIDLVVKTTKFCYVIEFKLNGTAEDAIAQIPFALENQLIIRLGISFSKKTRNIEKVIVG